MLHLLEDLLRLQVEVEETEFSFCIINSQELLTEKVSYSGGKVEGKVA
jgi:hypothetical protein